jgi:hypothetical protein
MEAKQPMPVTYTNRKGVTYTLYRSSTKTGKPRYVFAREPKGEPVEAIPDGYEITESVNGIVSLARTRPDLIPADELALVEQAIAHQHEHPQRYRVAAKQNRIEVYENSKPSADDLAAFMARIAPITPEQMQGLRAEEERYAQFIAVLRFLLVDQQQRTYRVERWCYRGSIDDWIDLGMEGTLPDLLERTIPRLGTEGFFDLFW